MRRHLAASALFAAGLVVTTASAQPPAGGTAPPPKPTEKKAPEKKPADGVDAQIGAALANDPDVKMARAKIALAEAELAKARQAIALKVTTLRSGIAAQRAALDSAAEQAAVAERQAAGGAASRAELLAAREKGAAAQAKLAGLEAELKLLVGDGPRAAAGEESVPTYSAAESRALALEYLRAAGSNSNRSLRALAPADRPAPYCTTCHDVGRDGNILEKDWHGCPGIAQEVARPVPAAPKGPVSDRLRAALDKTVSVGAKDAKVTFEQAVEAFKKDAGLDVPVRAEVKVGPVVSLGESLPVGAWLQLFADGTPGTRLLVREYGLLVTTKELAPPDGVSVFDFWKQKPAAAPKADGKPARGVSYRHQGRTGTLPYHATAHAKSDEAFRAAIGLVKAGKPSPTHPDPDAEWVKALDRDHMRFVIPDPRAFGLGTDEPVEIVVAMADLRNPAQEAWTRVGGKQVQKVADFGPDAAKALADALQSDAGPKR